MENRTYSDWLSKLMRDIDIANIPKDKVPQFTYFYVPDDEEKIIGTIAIRLATNELLKKRCGHIGYCVRPTERRKGYATKMLSEAIEFCRKINLNNLIIICDKSNSASIGVVKKCGGVLIEEFFSDEFQEAEQMYCIE